MNVETLKVVATQDSLSEQLMDTIRRACLDAKYDHMTIATLIGVLEMVKIEMVNRNAP